MKERFTALPAQNRLHRAMMFPTAACAHYLLPLLPLTVSLARVPLIFARRRRIHSVRVEAKALMEPKIICGRRGDGARLSSECRPLLLLCCYCSFGWARGKGVRARGPPAALAAPRVSGSNRSASSRRRRRQPFSPPPSPTALAAAALHSAAAQGYARSGAGSDGEKPEPSSPAAAASVAVAVAAAAVAASAGVAAPSLLPDESRPGRYQYHVRLPSTAANAAVTRRCRRRRSISLRLSAS